jgi:hypothetical protein
MSQVLKILALIFSLGILAPLHAADKPNLLVVGDDSDEGAVSRDSRVFKRVVARLNVELNEIVDVYDEAAVMPNNAKQSRVRRSDDELVDMARSVTRPPIDVLAVFSLYSSVTDAENGKQARARISARLLNVHSGKFIDNFETAPYVWTVSAGCDERECILEAMGDGVNVLGQELGRALATKYVWQLHGQTAVGNNGAASNDVVADYYLEFDGFSAQEMMEIEEYLVIFSGYASHRPTEQRHTRSIMLYRSSTGTAKLSRNLKKMLAELDMLTAISFAGNTYVMKRISLRGERIKSDSPAGW